MAPHTITPAVEVKCWCKAKAGLSCSLRVFTDRELVVTQDPFTSNHRRLRLQLAHEHRAWQAYWHQVAFLDESCFSLLDHDGRNRVRSYADERCFPECVIERHSGLIPGVMV
ncbi:transposable element Tcb1 transposase [Trichonephila clavipes]|nr:transposable element Tcb1 transposase [Trichonephila clavipes]